MLRVLYKLLFKSFGWKINGSLPRGLRKYVIAVAPHTSNWDFLVGIAARSILKITDAKFLAKSQLFTPLSGWLFRALGGYPVERSTSNDMVAQVAAIINSRPEFILAIAPEGTRKKVERLKTGFYHIARAANIPIVPVGFDYEKKEVVVGDALYPHTMEEDLETLHNFYRKIPGRNPAFGLSDVS
jgi:1-acyl-sn-glycerol-3-phosphate acyltransferase